MNWIPDRYFFTWDIHYVCNYRCSYCYFNDSWEKIAKKNCYPGIKRWKEIWDDIYQKYGQAHIHITGGEPFTYPDFIELVAYLVKKFTIEFDTNLFFNVDEFMLKIGPERVKFATAFHPQFSDFDKYLKKVYKLKRAEYDLGVNYVAFPEQLKEMAKYKKGFDEQRIAFDIMPFRGKYNEKEYPRGYSDEEKQLIRACDPQTATKMLDFYGQKDKIDGYNPHFGKLCRMGQKYAKIHADGSAYRCCLIREPGKLGNLIDGTFALYDEPKACNMHACSCWKAMIVGEEKNWSFYWVHSSLYRQNRNNQ